MDMQKIGTFLRELRQGKGLTQEQLAEILGVSGRTVSRWETAANMPDLSVLIQIAEYYGVEIKEILDGERKGEKMDQEFKDTLTKAADYSKAEKELSVRTGNTAFGVMYLVCAAAIALQLVLSANLRLVAGETTALTAGGLTYILLMVHRGTWDAGSGKRRSKLSDGVLSIVISTVFTVLYVLTIRRMGGSKAQVSAFAARFFIGISLLCFAALRGIAALSRRKKERLTRPDIRND